MLDDLDRVAVGICDSCDQQTSEPLVRGAQPGRSVGDEVGERGGSVVGPEDDRGSLALGNRVEAVVVARGRDRSNADLVAV